MTKWVSKWVTKGVSEWVSDWISGWVNVRMSANEAGTKGPMHISAPVAVYIVPCLPSKRGEDQGRPGRTSEPLVMCIVPRLPRKRGGDQGTSVRTSNPLAMYIVPPCDTKKAETKGRPSVYLSPWQYTLTHGCHTNEAETEEHQDVYPTPWRCALCHAYHKRDWDQGSPTDVHRTFFAAHIVLRLPRKRNGDQGMPAHLSDHWKCTLSTFATQKRQRPRDATAFIQPFGNVINPYLSQKLDAIHGMPEDIYDPLLKIEERRCRFS